jgi:hypothetical protein
LNFVVGGHKLVFAEYMVNKMRSILWFLGQCLWWGSLGIATTALLFALVIGEFTVLVVFLPRLTQAAGGVGMAFYLLGLPLTFALAMVLHEAGHLLAGRLAGLRPLFARVGPLTFTRIGFGWGWKCGWDWKAGWLGGFAACNLSVASRWRRLLFIAGGPLSNLMLGASAAIMPLVVPQAMIACWSGLFAVHSILLGLMCLLPLKDRGLPSDGLGLWWMLTGGDKGRPVIELRSVTWTRSRLPSWPPPFPG